MSNTAPPYKEDNKIIKNLGKTKVKPTYVLLGLVILFTLVSIALSFAEYIEKVYVVQSGNWTSIILLTILSGTFCSIFSLLLFFVGEIKNRMVVNGMLMGLIGGPIILLIFGFTPVNSELFAGVFILSTISGELSVHKDMIEN